MRCDEVKRSMMSYIDGKMPRHQVDKIERHLEVCPLCRRAYADDVEMIAAFRTETSGYAGPFFVDDVMKRIDIALESEYAKLKLNPMQKGVAAIAAFCALVVTAILWQVNWRVFAESSAFAAYYAAAKSAVLGWLGGLASMLSSLYGSASAALGATSSAYGSFADNYLVIIAIVTILAAIACIGLIGGFRSKFAEEWKA
jgi:anti-sigma factor RsiW